MEDKKELSQSGPLDSEKDKELAEATELPNEALEEVSGGRVSPEEGATCPGCGGKLNYVGFDPYNNEEQFVCLGCGERVVR